jgi:Tfp pilus assembly protein FimT
MEVLIILALVGMLVGLAVPGAMQALRGEDRKPPKRAASSATEATPATGAAVPGN